MDSRDSLGGGHLVFLHCKLLCAKHLALHPSAASVAPAGSFAREARVLPFLDPQVGTLCRVLHLQLAGAAGSPRRAHRLEDGVGAGRGADRRLLRCARRVPPGFRARAHGLADGLAAGHLRRRGGAGYGLAARATRAAKSPAARLTKGRSPAKKKPAPAMSRLPERAQPTLRRPGRYAPAFSSLASSGASFLRPFSVFSFFFSFEPISSRIATRAPSPTRHPAATIRVYPPERSAKRGAISLNSFLVASGVIRKPAAWRRAWSVSRLPSVMTRSTSGRAAFARASVVVTRSRSMTLVTRFRRVARRWAGLRPSLKPYLRCRMVARPRAYSPAVSSGVGGAVWVGGGGQMMRPCSSNFMPRPRPILCRISLISFSDLRPKFFVFSISFSLFWTSSRMLWMLAFFRQL